MDNETINYHHLSIYEAKHEYKKLWDTVEFTFRPLHFTDEMITAIVSIASDLCGVCKENTGSCQCSNDE